MTVTIDPRTVGPVGSRCPDGDHIASDECALKKTVQPRRDLVALYGSRLAGAEIRRPAVAVKPVVVPVPFGRALRQVTEPPAIEREPTPIVERPIPQPAPARPRWHFAGWWAAPAAGLRRLVTAAFVATLLFTSLGQVTAAQQRYRVQPGDTLESVAAEFGVDPRAILQSSFLVDPPNLTPGDVIVIPDPWQSPDEAAGEAAANEGTSPWVAGAYYVESGDSIEVIAALFGVDLSTLISVNGLDNADLLEVGQRLLIPGSGDESTADTSQGSGLPPGIAETNFPGVPTYVQQRNLSCEYASAFIATSAFGDGVSEWVFMDRISQADNPHRGYRGDIDGRWGNYDDYGIYPEPLVPVLNDYGFAAEVFYGGSDPSTLEAHLDAGHPVVVWLALWGDTGIVFNDDGRYTVFAGEHVMVAYAYDEAGVYLSDPGTGRYRFYTWESFRWMWGTSDGMSLAVYPM